MSDSHNKKESKGQSASMASSIDKVWKLGAKAVVSLWLITGVLKTIGELIEDWGRWYPQLQQLYTAFKDVILTFTLSSLNRFVTVAGPTLTELAFALSRSILLTSSLFFVLLFIVRGGLATHATGKRFPDAFAETVLRENIFTFFFNRKPDNTARVSIRGIIALTLAAILTEATFRVLAPDVLLNENSYFALIPLVIGPLFIITEYRRLYPSKIEEGVGHALLSSELWRLESSTVDAYTCEENERNQFKTCARAFRICHRKDRFDRVYGEWQLDYVVSTDSMQFCGYSIWLGKKHKITTCVWAVLDLEKDKWCIIDSAVGFDSEEWNIMRPLVKDRKRSWPKVFRAFVAIDRDIGRLFISQPAYGDAQEKLWKAEELSRKYVDMDIARLKRKLSRSPKKPTA